MSTVAVHSLLPTDRRRQASFHARVGLVIAGLLLPLLTIELLIRLLGPVLPGYYFTGQFLVQHPLYGRFHALEYDGWLKTSEYTSRMTTNSLGLRGPERGYAKPPGVRRVLVLGDSFAEAAQVHESEGVVSMLERQLNEANGDDDPQWEAINASVAGWGQNQQLTYLLAEGQHYQPDLVVVAMYLGNDPLDSSWELQGRPRRPVEPYWVVDDKVGLRPLRIYPRGPEYGFVKELLVTRTVVWNVFETGMLSQLTGTNEPDEPQDGWRLSKHAPFSTKRNTRVDAAWKSEVALFNRITDEAERIGARTAVVVIPGMFQVYDDDWARLIRENRLNPEEWSQTRPNEVLAQLRPSIKAPVYDMLPALRERAPGSPPLYFVRDRHWTRDGHAIATEEILAFLRRQQLVP